MCPEETEQAQPASQVRFSTIAAHVKNGERDFVDAKAAQTKKDLVDDKANAVLEYTDCRVCGRLSKDTPVPIPIECYLLWQRRLCICDYLQEFKWGEYPGLSKWALNIISSVLM